MTSINTNVGALNARLYSLKSASGQERAMERLSSGQRINSAADDAAGLAVAGKMESQLRGINMAIRNNQDGIGLIQTAEAGINEIRNMVLRMRELAVQMSNGIYEDTPDRDNAQLEVDALLSQVNLIAGYTTFNDVNVLDGTYAAVDIQAGNTTTETIALTIASMSTTGLLIATAKVTAQSTAKAAITTMDTALETISSAQATLGSYQNRLAYSVANLSRSSVMTEQALGRIMDADFAAETTNLSKTQILNQAATAMLAQANQSKSLMLQLIQ
ncbi:flagellin [Alphaproteobacteria bacterium]|jgi:flagellin|nr:flagellin [Alphaproteobacteria bacterium]